MIFIWKILILISECSRQCFFLIMKKSIIVFFMCLGVVIVAACPCLPGTHCVVNSTDCRRCKPSTYQDKKTYGYSCIDCAVSCKQKEFVLSKCTEMKNLQCQCVDGYYRATGIATPCLPHSMCGAGLEESAPGTPFNDTVCRPCEPGHFRTENSKIKYCTACKDCSEDEYIATSCSSTRNTVCGQRRNITLVVVPSVLVAIFLLSCVAGALFCLHRRGHNLRFWESCTKKQPEKPGSGESHYLTSNGSTDSPVNTVRLPNNGTSSSHHNGYMQSNHSHSQAGAPASVGVTSDEDVSRGRNRNPSQTQDGGAENSFILSLSKKLCGVKDWKMFLRSLIGAGSDEMITTAEANNPNNIQEQIYQVLSRWKQENPENATKERVIEELKNNDLNLLASIYESGSVTEV